VAAGDVEADRVGRIRRRRPSPVRGDSPLRKGIEESGQEVDRPRHSVSPRVGTVSSSRVDHGCATPDIIHGVRTGAEEAGGGFTLSKATSPLKTLRAPPWRADSRYGSRVLNSVPNLVWVRRDLVETRSFTPEDCCPAGGGRLPIPTKVSFSRELWEKELAGGSFAEVVKMAGGGLGEAGKSSRLGRRR
jgi:hypothetical protein